MTTALQAYRRNPSLAQQAAATDLVRSMQEAFNAKDADALGRNLAEDAVWTNARGMRAVGRGRIVELGREMMKRFDGNFARYEIAHLMPVGDEACVVNVVQIPTDRSGRDLEETGATPIFVIAHVDEGWKIVAGQNTLIADQDAEGLAMADKSRIAIILGSTREGRMAEIVADWVRRQVEADGRLEPDIVDPLEIGLLGYGRQDRAALAATGKRLAAADAFIVVTPEYNHSYTGELKSFIDSFGEEWRDKPVGFVSYGGISGGLRAVEHLRQVFAELRAVGLRDTVSFAKAWNRFEPDGRLGDPQDAEQAIIRLLGQLDRWAVFLRDLRRRQSAEAVA